MDWSNERYIRVYTRDTKSWLKSGWEGQTLLMHLFRKVDRAGCLDGIDDPVEDLTLITGLPREVVGIGLERLLDQKTIKIVDESLVIPNFIEAQEASVSDRERQRKSRETRRAKALLGEVLSKEKQKPAPINNKSPRASSPDLIHAENLCAHMLCEMNAENKTTAKVTKKWIDDMEKIIRIDKRDPTQIYRVIQWACHDTGNGDSSWPGWSVNVRSPAKLRKHFETLEIQMNQRQRIGRQNLTNQERAYQRAMNVLKGE